MPAFSLFLRTALLLTGALWVAPDALAAARGVRVEAYGGWPEAVVLESRETGIKAVVVPAAGGRVVFYGRTGNNLLWENPDAAGKTLATSPEGFPGTGYQCDVGPEVGGMPEHLLLWLGRHEWGSRKPHSLWLRSGKDPGVHLQIEKEYVLDPDTGDLALEHRMKNIGNTPTAWCFWNRALCRGGGFILIPLNPKSRFPAGWSIRREEGGKYRYDGRAPQSDKVQIMDGVLVARAEGAATKVGADASAEWIAYILGRELFVNYAPVFSSGVYSDGGNTFEAYWDERVAELEPLSPEARLKDGKSYEFPGKWSLIELPADVTTFEEARATVAKVPPSPFQ